MDKLYPLLLFYPPELDKLYPELTCFCYEISPFFEGIVIKKRK